MSRIEKAFKDNKKVFISFLTGGDPSIEKTKEYILDMERAGAGIVEIGIPFSDPIAEGPVIQEANIRALSAGFKIPQIFKLVEMVREESQIPLVFLTYLNPVFHYGYEAFFAKCEEVGLDGIIIPDMPFEEKGELEPIAKAHKIDVISLIAPTSEERIRSIARNATGFIYVVSSMGVTGMRSHINTNLESMIQLVREETSVPCAVGFGINTPQQSQRISHIADGVIVGSAIVKIIEKYSDHAGEKIYEYVKSMADAMESL